jgi:hypothetical protein
LARRSIPKRGIKKGIPKKGNSLFEGNSKRGRGRDILQEFLQEFLFGGVWKKREPKKGMHNLGLDATRLGEESAAVDAPS